jgi:hypothetical protein
MSPERMRRASSSIRSTVGCGSLGTGAVGPDVGVAMLPRWGWSSDVRQAYVRAGYADPTAPQTRRWFLQGTSPRLEPDLVLTVAKRGPRRRRTALPTRSPAVPSPGIVDRHRCDEPLCTADDHLERGTATDNRRDMIARPYRAADIDTRGCAGRAGPSAPRCLRF